MVFPLLLQLLFLQREPNFPMEMGALRASFRKREILGRFEICLSLRAHRDRRKKWTREAQTVGTGGRSDRRILEIQPQQLPLRPTTEGGALQSNAGAPWT